MGSDYVIRKVALVSWCRQRLTRPDGQDASLGEISDQTSHNLILLRLKLTVNIDQGSLTSQGLGDHPAPPSVSYLEWVCGYEGHTWPTGRIRHMPATTHPPPSTTRWIYFKVTLSLSRRLLLKREQRFAKTLPQPPTLSILFQLGKSCRREWRTCHRLVQTPPLHPETYLINNK